MKLSSRDALIAFSKPDPKKMAILIYGANAMRVALKRQELIRGLIGPDGEEEMRLTRLQGGELRRDIAALNDAIKAVGFFPGPRVVLVEDANENCADTILAALSDWQPGDAQMVIIGGAMKPTSKIRKALETHPNTWALAVYDEPPSAGEVKAAIEKAGLDDLSPEADISLSELSKTLDPGDFQQYLEKLSLYCMSQVGPVTATDVEQCAPQSTEAVVDDLIGLVADLKDNQLPLILQKISAQGVTATGLCISALRHFRMLHTAACDPSGIAQGLSRLRPPVFGPRRDRLQRQINLWSREQLEKVISLLLDTDLKLRSAGQTAPQMAQVERCFIRISMMGKR